MQNGIETFLKKVTTVPVDYYEAYLGINMVSQK
jgi:hypothetical protein